MDMSSVMALEDALPDAIHSNPGVSPSPGPTLGGRAMTNAYSNDLQQSDPTRSRLLNTQDQRKCDYLLVSPYEQASAKLVQKQFLTGRVPA